MHCDLGYNCECIALIAASLDIRTNASEGFNELFSSRPRFASLKATCHWRIYVTVSETEVAGVTLHVCLSPNSRFDKLKTEGKHNWLQVSKIQKFVSFKQ